VSVVCVKEGDAGGDDQDAFRVLDPLGIGDHARARRTRTHPAAPRIRALRDHGTLGRVRLCVPVFHGELGGVARASEYVNTRDNGRFGSNGEVEMLDPRVREWLGVVQKEEDEIYEDASERFKKRAQKCRCLKGNESEN